MQADGPSRPSPQKATPGVPSPRSGSSVGAGFSGGGGGGGDGGLGTGAEAAGAAAGARNGRAYVSGRQWSRSPSGGGSSGSSSPMSSSFSALPRLMLMFVVALIVVQIGRETLVVGRGGGGGGGQGDVRLVTGGLQMRAAPSTELEEDGRDDLDQASFGALTNVIETDDPSWNTHELEDIWMLNEHEGETEHSRLPRSSSRPYNEVDPEQRYLAYTPSGGFNNQLICLQNALFLARQTGRQLIVPPKAIHHNFYWRYMRLKGGNVIPMDHALDLDYMEKAWGTNLIPINKTLQQWRIDEYGITGEDEMFKKETDRVDFLVVPQDKSLRHRPQIAHDKVVERAKRSTKHLWFYHGALYTHTWRDDAIRMHIRYSPYIRKFANIITDRIFGDGQFNAFHLRLGDKLQIAREDATNFLRPSRKLEYDPDVPVYIATDADRSAAYFDPLRKKFKKLVFAADFLEDEVLRTWIEDYNSRVPPTQIRNDLLGLVEQLVCVRATKFIGITQSTFSKTILSFRRHLNISLPIIAHEMGNPQRQTADVIYSGSIRNYFVG